MSILFYLTLFVFIFLSILTIFVILMQESKSSGLGSAFGSDASGSLFGTSTADILKKFTAYLAAFFMISCLVLSLWTSSLARKNNSTAPTQIEEVQN